MLASGEMQSYLSQLKAQDRKIGKRNRALTVALCGGVAALLIVLWIVYRATIGAYAVIDPESIRIEQDPINEGKLTIKFDVTSPGEVFCRRTSGDVQTDLIDTFHEPCKVERPWSWQYQPGQDINVTLWYRGGLFRCEYHAPPIPTSARADIVILMDTTESMEPYIDALKGKCAVFSQRLGEKDLKHRFALIGFGDTNSPPWIDRHEFTSDVLKFTASVEGVERFSGGDLPESALDALEAALDLPLDNKAIRRFYLVTNNKFHPKTRSGATAKDIADRLQKQRVALQVFSKERFREDFGELLGKNQRFLEIENFGKVLSQGRILED